MNTSPQGKISKYRAFSLRCNQIFLNKYFIAALFLGACAVIAAGQEVAGAVIYICVICAALVLCEDIMATTMPFLLLCVFLTNCYDSYDTFIKFVPVAVPAALSIVFHFVYFRKKLSVGSTFPGLAAVSVALLLGGVGFISPADYFRPMTLYYTIFLGIGMLVFYLLFKSQTAAPREYDVREKLMAYFYIMGLLACFSTAAYIVKNIELIKEVKNFAVFQAGNNISTILLFALPCPFYFVKKNRLHMLSPLIMYAFMLLSGSRSGLILGAVQLLLCILVSAYWDKPRRWLYITSAAALAVIGVIAFNAVVRISLGHADISTLITMDDTRVKLLQRAKEIFPQCFVFGHGLGYTGNTDLYSPVKGAMEWYHMMIPQIVAGLGIVGTAAYLFQFYLRGRAFLTALKESKTGGSPDKPLIITMFLSYIGVLLMSQVNPGLFCPLPYTLMAVMIFALLDGKTYFSFKKEK